MSGTGQFIADADAFTAYREKVGKRYTLERDSRRTRKIELFDTFDWRLHAKGLFAFRDGNTFAVGRSLSGPVSFSCAVTAVPLFWYEFEDAGAREFLRDVTGVRALLPMATVAVKEDTYSARNRDGKIVCRISFVGCRPSGGDPVSYILVKPLRGYSGEGERIAAMASRSDMKTLAVPVLEDLLLRCGMQPGGYSSKLDLRLDRKMTISEAAVLIDRELLSTIRSNVQGVLEDWDTEFLHDLRVATRRTRACLTQLKEALPSAEASRYRDGFREVAQRCNELRDLDVYLLERQSYYDMLPGNLHGGLDRYFNYIERKRARRHREFSKYLESGAFELLVDGWDTFLDDPSILVNDSPAIDIAGAMIWSRFQRVLKKGRKISDSAPDARFHELRIECKKLRYLLEFFQSFYPGKKMGILILHLKGFQDNLGEYNDLTVQQQDLKKYLKSSRGAQDARLRDAAIGGLLTALSVRQKKARKEYYRRFAEFDSEENRALYEELFNRERK